MSPKYVRLPLLRVHVRPDGVILPNYRESPRRQVDDGWWRSAFDDPRSRAGQDQGEPRPAVTLGDMHREPYWVWLSCTNYVCTHRAPVALAPFIIRWGADAPREKLARSFRCVRCGHKGAYIHTPSWAQGSVAPFPTANVASEQT